MDEVATNTYDHRRKVLGMVSGMGRVFKITPGGDGRMPFHVTLALTSCASGIYSIPINGIDGAPPPMIIHACSSSPTKHDCLSKQSPTDVFYQNPSYSEGLCEPYSVMAEEGDVKKNPWGFLVRTAENGSMTQRTFYDFCMHFVKHLPKGQGKHGKPVILFLDGHSSCWDVSSLLYLMSNNIFPFLLPSHNSIWTQPNENGVNLRWLKSLETAVSTLGMRNSGLSTTPQYFNIILRHAWKVFLQSEHNELLTCMENNTTST